MAELRIVIPDELAPRILDALCARFAYDPASGLTKQQFVRDRLKDWIRTEVREHEQAMAEAQARSNVAAVEF